jgi:TetR/AcrR family transcriptional regulator, fatty acid metabolism regulator protein
MRSKSGLAGRTFTEQARRAQLIGCAVELIAEHGYMQASVSRIAERAGVAKSVVLYHFESKDELVGAVITDIYLTAAAIMVPAIEAESTAAGKLRAYIRSNAAFIDAHREQALTVLEIWTSYRTSSGLRLDEAAAQSEPGGDLAKLDPEPIFRLGQEIGEFREFPPQAMAVAMRQAVDGAVLMCSRDRDFDVLGYCEELVTVFDLATRKRP